MYQAFQVESEGTSLYCRKYGMGRPLLMIHGACVDCDFFSGSAEALSRYFQVYTYDRRGYGRNSVPKENNHSFSAQVEDAVRVLNTIDTPCHVIAHSAGAAIALGLASVISEKIGHILLHEPALWTFASEDVHAELTSIGRMIAHGERAKALVRSAPLFGTNDSSGRQGTADEVEHMHKNCMCFLDEFHDIFSVALTGHRY